MLLINTLVSDSSTWRHWAISRDSHQISVFEKCIEMVKRFWTKSSDVYTVPLSAISVDASQEERKENQALQDNWVNVRYNGQTQASEIIFHIRSLLLMHIYITPPCLNAILILFRHPQLQHLWDSKWTRGSLCGLSLGPTEIASSFPIMLE